MIKRIVLNVLVILVVTTAAYSINSYLINNAEISLPFSLINIYLFNLIAYIIICLLVELVAIKLPTQVGYLYLGTVFIKLGIFVLLFKEAIFNAKEMMVQQKISLVIPVLLYLTLEAIYCGRLMNLK